ncbi:MAG: Mth938-like domain-containing protein [Pseudomonadota bacterium]
MDVTPLVRAGTQIIQSYSGGSFKISGSVYEGAVFVTTDAVELWAFSKPFNDLSENDFQYLIAQASELDVVLLGTGEKSRFFPPILRQRLKEAGLTVEAMDTGAASRTYNVLMAEGRRVAAALLPS